LIGVCVRRYGSGVEHSLDKRGVESSNLSVGIDIYLSLFVTGVIGNTSAFEVEESRFDP
jgi:hypothetical protein